MQGSEFGSCKRRGTTTGSHLVHGGRSLFVLGLFFGVAPTAEAIPSPDLVVNLSASIAQLFGLVTVVFGGLTASLRWKSGRSSVMHLPLRHWTIWSLVAISLVALAINLFQYSRYQDATNQRLETNLLRSSIEEGKTVGDTSLKTLSFSKQLVHPRGVQTNKLARWIAEGRRLNLIDVREPEEIEKGRIENSSHIRYPDLLQNPSTRLRNGAENVLLCFSGNRSSELCDTFTAQGLSCRFMVGGYEKWLAERRSLERSQSRNSKNLRDLPSHRNQSTLLDTPEVMQLVAEKNALFVDVRYPGDFERGHLPSAINLPLRKLPSAEMWSRLKSLPKRPIIAPCYDKRSCFYAEILGLRLDRLGYDFRGRYTVPHEYFVPRVEQEHVVQWRTAQQGRTPFTIATAHLSTLLTKLEETTGHLAVAIVLLVLGLRAAFLPLSLKADRDQRVQASLAAEITDLKKRLACDPHRLSRAIRGVYRNAGLTPLRNTLGSIAQLILFLLFFTAVTQAASGSDQNLLWSPALGQPDPTLLLPVSAGVLLFVCLALTGLRHNHVWLIGYAVGAAVLAYLLIDMSTAVNFYLVISLLSMLAQIGLSHYLHKPSTTQRDPNSRIAFLPSLQQDNTGIVPLRDAHRLVGTGNKAARLAQMQQAGLPVPDGFCVTSEWFSRRAASNSGTRAELPAKERRRLTRFWSGLGSDRAAVRSSGLNEDGANQSYAGVFESKLNVTWEGLLVSLYEVQESLHSERASVYGGNAQETGGVIVQTMVDAAYAGVLFTEHPAHSGAMLVEVVEGLGESLVSGTSTPEAYCFGAMSGRSLDGKVPPIDLQPLLELGTKVRVLFHRPQDIEWAYTNGRFMLLQTRDITRTVRDGDTPRNLRERERHRLLRLVRDAAPDETLLVQSELSELIPRPTPLSATFLERFWAAGGSTDLACRRLGIPYEVWEGSPPYVNTVYGGLYINRLEANRRVRQGPGALASFRLARSAEAIEQQYRSQFLPVFLREIRIHETVNLNELHTTELLVLLETWSDEFFTKNYLQAEIINLAADFYWKTATQKLARADLDPADYLTHAGETVVHQAMSILPDIRSGTRRVDDFIQFFGHRAPMDYELAQARYQEDTELVSRLVARAERSVHSSVSPASQPKDRLLALSIERAGRFQILKEEAKHHVLRQVANLRRLFLEIDKRLELDQGIFYLRWDEIPDLRTHECLERMQTLIAHRKREAELLADVPIPSTVSLGQLECVDSEFSTTPAQVNTRKLKGIRVAGEGDVVGSVRVLVDSTDSDPFENDHILVARFTDPTWTPLFARARGVVTEIGGWLSHAAIVAREYNLTTIVGASNATQQLKTGQLVRLNTDGTIDQLAERRQHQRLTAEAEILLLYAGNRIPAKIHNVSKSGVRVETDERLETWANISVQLSNTQISIQAQIVRQDITGDYGLQFISPLSSEQSEALWLAA